MCTVTACFNTATGQMTKKFMKKYRFPQRQQNQINQQISFQKKLFHVTLCILSPVEQGFSNCGSQPQMGPWSQLAWQIRYKAFVNFTRKLKVGLQWVYFYCILRGNTVLHALSCLLGCLLELSNDNNQPSTTRHALLHHDCFNILTNIDVTAFILTQRQLVFRTLGLVY